ncbi:hypothetical protein Q4610_15570 [Sphingobium sp. HBC34]|uniref:Uncharacterized protein n=1 Tax=Sphingobium cyanobacteriorum TaxID=3063954 RepID=A0ABT8ZQI6_9SPHN|nr:hypothetical protein [Sphingobium sp. HBC34]MDO7836467.1 hypothetical protein [Sphingobium sp. HBC34]
MAIYNRNARQAFEDLPKSEPILGGRMDPASSAALILRTIRGVHVQWLAERKEFDAGRTFRALCDLIELEYARLSAHPCANARA